jgi:4-carboxymuconolactone decarboxylase
MTSPPPRPYRDFVARYPELAEAWDAARRAEQSSGPLSERDRRAIKLGIAIGAQRQGAVSSATRKALAAGLEPAEIEQVVALATSTIGFPASVACHGWIRDAMTPHSTSPRGEVE